MLTAIFVGAGVIILFWGRWLYQRYRDDRLQDQKGFRDFGIGPRGLLAYAGVVLMLFGGAMCLVGFILPSILR